jgi:minor extracellular serine protease Vpr
LSIFFLSKHLNMKHLILLCLFLCSVLLLSGQTRYHSEWEFFRHDLKDEVNKHGQISSDFMKKYPISMRQGNFYVSALALVNSAYSPDDLIVMGIRPGSRNGNIVTLRIPVHIITENLNLSGVEYIEPAGKTVPYLDKATRDSRVDSVHMGWYLPVPLSGNNVIIGITDWGFDYTHPMFYDTSLTHTRILAAWDQFRNEGPAPAGFNYGTLFEGAAQLLTAQCDTFNIYEYATHGTHVAGIAAGSGAGTIYRGVAFNANLLFTTFLIDAAAVVDAFSWMKQYAVTLGKRLVINMSWGLYYMGNLDGTSLLSQVIDLMSADGVVFVSSAGNNGDVVFHVKKDFSSPADTMKTIIKFDSYAYYPKMWGQSITMWGHPGDTFSIALKILDQQNTLLAETPFYQTATSPLFTDSLMVINNDTIFYNLACDPANPMNMRPHIRLRVRNTKTSAYKVALYAVSPGGIVHFWNVIELTNDVGNWGSAFQAPAPGWTAGDTYYGIGEPTCAESVITVASHASQVTTANNTVINGGISYFSSYGPLITEVVKPDLSAPGSNICSSISSFTNASIPGTSVITSVNFNGRTYKFVRFSGTSMSSPHVAGVVALLLEANPLLTPAEIKQILRTTARQDDKTGVIPPEGSIRWGWGKLNALMAVYHAMNIQGEQEHVLGSSVRIFPNPADQHIQIESDHFHPAIVYLVNMKGGVEGQYRFQNDETPFIDVSQISPGTYLLFMNNGSAWRSEKFIRQ